MRFDAYAGNVRDARSRDVAEALSWSLKGAVGRGPKLRRYGDTMAIEVAGRMACWIGQDEGNGCIYFEGKGETSPTLAKGVRTHFPDHTVSRADVCEDYDAEGAFASLQALVRAHKGPRVRAGYIALPDDPERGATWAAGVRGGVAMIRVYESGKHPDRVHLARPNLARIELEARPHYATAKAVAAKMDPLAFWGLSAWTHRVGEALSQVEVPRYVEEPRPPSYDKTTLYLARTFDRFWQESEDAGIDWYATVRAIRQDDAEAKARWKARSTGSA